MSSNKLSRRKFLSLTAFTAAGAALTACGQAVIPEVATETAPAPSVRTKVPTKAVVPSSTPLPTAPPEPTLAAKAVGEAPMLTEMVKSGKPPPLLARIPLNPKVIVPFDEVGAYGETLNRGTTNVSGFLCTNQFHESLFEYPYPFLSSGEVEPNLAESWEFNSDGTELTVYLREGLK